MNINILILKVLWEIAQTLPTPGTYKLVEEGRFKNAHVIR